MGRVEENQLELLSLLSFRFFPSSFFALPAQKKEKEKRNNQKQSKMFNWYRIISAVLRSHNVSPFW